eukprot:jgi/Psemu1/26501/gm1.26501_g
MEATSFNMICPQCVPTDLLAYPIPCQTDNQELQDLTPLLQSMSLPFRTLPLGPPSATTIDPTSEMSPWTLPSTLRPPRCWHVLFPGLGGVHHIATQPLCLLLHSADPLCCVPPHVTQHPSLTLHTELSRLQTPNVLSYSLCFPITYSPPAPSSPPLVHQGVYVLRPKASLYNPQPWDLTIMTSTEPKASQYSTLAASTPHVNVSYVDAASIL